MAEKSSENDWCEDCEQYLWMCDCDEHEALSEEEITDIEFLNIHEEMEDGEKFSW